MRGEGVRREQVISDGGGGKGVGILFLVETGENRQICSKCEEQYMLRGVCALPGGVRYYVGARSIRPTMELPRVNTIGVIEIPSDFQARRRRYSLIVRVVATAVLALFALVATVTTVVSLGSYCLTSDGSNASGLPQSFLRP